MPAVLVVGREPRRVRALRNLSVDDLLEGVDALGRILGIDDVHKMHGGGLRVVNGGGMLWAERLLALVSFAAELANFEMVGIFADHRNLGLARIPAPSRGGMAGQSAWGSD